MLFQVSLFSNRKSPSDRQKSESRLLAKVKKVTPDIHNTTRKFNEHRCCNIAPLRRDTTYTLTFPYRPTYDPIGLVNSSYT